MIKDRISFITLALAKKLVAEAIAELGDYLEWVGVTTTQLTDGSSTNPIVINGDDYTAKAGDVTAYDNNEFIFNGSVWQNFSQLLGSAAYKNATTVVEAGSLDLPDGNAVYNANETVYEAVVAKGDVATVQANLTASKAYAVGEQLYYKETLTLYTVTAPIAQGGTIVLTGEGANVEVSDKLTDQIKDAKDGIATLDSEKLDKYSTTPSDWDTTPTASSTKPVISGGEYNTALGEYQLVKDTVGWTGKNFITFPYPYVVSTYGSDTFTEQGINWSIADDGTVTAVSGTGVTNGQIILSARYDNDVTIRLKKGKYILSGSPNESAPDIHLGTTKNGSYYDIPNAISKNGSESIFEITDDILVSGKDYATVAVYIKCGMGTVVNNFVFKPMIRRADILDPTFEPYHAPVSQTKADNTTIAPVEDGDKYSTSYPAYKVFIRGGKLRRTKVAVTSADTPTLNTNYVDEPDVASDLDIVESTASLIANELGVTLDGTVKYIKKYGKLVQVYCRINVSTAQTVSALTSILDTGYPTVIDGTKLNVITRAAPYAPATFSAHITPTGTIALPKDAVLGAQGYDIFGTFLTK